MSIWKRKKKHIKAINIQLETVKKSWLMIFLAPLPFVSFFKKYDRPRSRTYGTYNQDYQLIS